MIRKPSFRSAFICDAASSPDRRSVLAGLAALAFAPVASASNALAEQRLRIGDLSNDNGVATDAAKARLGEEITLRGYFAPSMRTGVLFDLFEKPAALCMCGFFHDAGASIAVTGAERPAGLTMLRMVEVQGRIAVDGRGKAQVIAGRIVAA